MNRDKKPSEAINDFLAFLNMAKVEYEIAYDAVGKEDLRVQDFLHSLELAKDKAERNRIATAFQRSRKERRRNKDKVQLYENVYNFYTAKANQDLIKALRRLQNEQVVREKYLFGERKYTKRVSDDE